MRRELHLILFLVSAFFLVSSAYAQEVRYVSITNFEGKVEVRVMGGEWIHARTGMILREKQEIRTGLNSKVELLIDKRGSTGRLEIGPSSRVRLNTLDVIEDTGDKETLLDVAIGRMMIFVNELEEGSNFNVRTPGGSMGVRGTQFEVIVEEKS